jgi:hypothetical protein
MTAIAQMSNRWMNPLVTWNATNPKIHKTTSTTANAHNMTMSAFWGPRWFNPCGSVHGLYVDSR